jgi:hypothetical protein
MLFQYICYNIIKIKYFIKVKSFHYYLKLKLKNGRKQKIKINSKSYKKCKIINCYQLIKKILF